MNFPSSLNYHFKASYLNLIVVIWLINNLFFYRRKAISMYLLWPQIPHKLQQAWPREEVPWPACSRTLAALRSGREWWANKRPPTSRTSAHAGSCTKRCVQIIHSSKGVIPTVFNGFIHWNSMPSRRSWK